MKLVCLAVLVGCSPHPKAVEPPANAAPRTTTPDAQPGPSREDVVAISRFGFYTVDATPRATLYIDNTRVGDTPIRRLPIGPGQHHVRLVGPNGLEKVFPIMVFGGRDLDGGTVKL